MKKSLSKSCSVASSFHCVHSMDWFLLMQRLPLTSSVISTWWDFLHCHKYFHIYTITVIASLVAILELLRVTDCQRIPRHFHKVPSLWKFWYNGKPDELLPFGCGKQCWLLCSLHWCNIAKHPPSWWVMFSIYLPLMFFLMHFRIIKSNCYVY